MFDPSNSKIEENANPNEGNDQVESIDEEKQQVFSI